MKCANLSLCPFYNKKMSMEKGLGSIFRKKYCEDNHENCARYYIFERIGPQLVPDSLYPNMMDVAEKLVEEYQIIVRKQEEFQ